MTFIQAKGTNTSISASIMPPTSGVGISSRSAAEEA
eukprot:CAMPEP_0194226130 /NCGR_PEP_ID=MMETSP0156-20130528/41226_1 /TAXON_ID=33649 /ORGANISM="Thalassionema nitzschioides, Strain L26-B" /LENGTH=35 /DNA_ID= /DNA_START= /DNA_END= /DNA_ORIENTATION=